MQQKEKVGTPSKLAGQVSTSTGPADVIPAPGAEPDVIRPRCVSAHCVARRERGELRPDKSPIGDPLRIMRLRYDFPDGVVAETLFCADCRGAINATLYGFDRTILGAGRPKADGKIPEPPATAPAKPTEPA